MAMFYLENRPHAVTREGIHIATQNHFDYICREGKYNHLNDSREDLVYKSSGNMPWWAESEKQFWTEAEKHRRSRGRAYREIKMALQEELTLEENIGLVETFCERMGISKEHAYTYAIHDKPAAFDSSHRNIHCHLMFDERIIERGRSLDKDQYFWRYSSDKEGFPTGGYKKDRYFVTKQATLDMRKVWAELVNEKFAEKGLDCRISEKTLKAQYYELKKAGKDDKAEYYNRTPAPHMGEKYRNPKKKEKVMERTHSLEQELLDYTDEKNGTFYDAHEDYNKTQEEIANATEEERKIFFFAADALMRKLAREIQQERKKQKAKEAWEKRMAIKREQKVKEAKEAAEKQKTIEKENIAKREAENVYDEEMAQPMVITIGDIHDTIVERLAEFDKSISGWGGYYKELQAKLLSDEAIQAKAENEILAPGRKIIDDYKVALQKKEKTQYALQHNSYLDYNDYIKLVDEDKAASIAFNAAQKKYLKFKCEEKPEETRAKIQARVDAIKQKQAKISEEAKKAYKYYNYNKKQRDIYKERLDIMLRDYKEDTIVYASELPKILERRHRLRGNPNWRVDKLPQLISTVEGYSVFRTISDSFKEADGREKIYAVREGDYVTRGFVPVYELKVKVSDAVNKNWKHYRKLEVVEIAKTNRIMYLYKTHNQMGVGVNPFEKLPGIENTSYGKVVCERLQNRANKLKAYAGKIANNPPHRKIEKPRDDLNGNLISIKENENEKMQKQDAYKEAEQAMDSFAAGLRLGRGGGGMSR